MQTVTETGATRPQRLQEAGRTLRCSLPREHGPADTATADVWTQNHENRFLWFEATGCVAFCSSGSRRLTQPGHCA